MLDDEFAAAADDWLRATGTSVIYRSSDTGLSYPLYATLEQDISTVDDHGMTTNGHVVTLKTGEVPAPARGDLIEFADSEYRVDELLDDPGHLLRLLVTKS